VRFNRAFVSRFRHTNGYIEVIHDSRSGYYDIIAVRTNGCKQQLLELPNRQKAISEARKFALKMDMDFDIARDVFP
jgi:predicted amino acid racemase